MLIASSIVCFSAATVVLRPSSFAQAVSNCPRLMSADSYLTEGAIEGAIEGKVLGVLWRVFVATGAFTRIEPSV